MRTRIDLDAYAAPLSALSLAKLAEQELTYLDGQLADTSREFTTSELTDLANECGHMAHLHLSLAWDAYPSAVRRQHLTAARHALQASDLLRPATGHPDRAALGHVRFLLAASAASRDATPLRTPAAA